MLLIYFEARHLNSIQVSLTFQSLSDFLGSASLSGVTEGVHFYTGLFLHFLFPKMHPKEWILMSHINTYLYIALSTINGLAQ